MDNSKEEEESAASSTNFLVIIWVVSFVIIICIPLCLNRQRSIWWKRMASCRWNVHLDPEPDPEWYGAELRRHAEVLQRHEELRERAIEVENRERLHLSIEEEEEIRQLFLLERLAGFTMALEEKDFHVTENVKSSKSLDTTNSATSAKESLQIKISEKNSKATETKDSHAEKDDDFSFDEYSKICVPFAGESLDKDSNNFRLVPNGCAICLCEFESGDRICWSSTAEDPHVFHEECLLNYFNSVGQKESRRRNNRQENRSVDQDNVQVAKDFPTLCPSCRQQFVSLDNKVSDSERSENKSDEVDPDDRYDV